MTRTTIFVMLAVVGCGERRNGGSGMPIGTDSPMGMPPGMDPPTAGLDARPGMAVGMDAAAEVDARMAAAMGMDAAPGMGMDGGAGAYALVPGWPVLEPGLALGQVSGLAIEAAGTLMVFSRADRPWSGGPMTDPIRGPTLLRLDPSTGAVRDRFGQGRFAIPHGLHVDPAGNLWVTDAGTHRVVKLSPTGEVLLQLGTGSPGNDMRSFNQPTDVHVAADGTVFVADGYGNTRVVRLSPTGAYLGQWGTRGAGPGQFNTPHSITGDAQGRIYVADRGNSRIQRFDPQGRFLDQWKSASLGRPWAVTIAPDGMVYVVDGGDQNPRPPDRAGVVKLDQTGRLLDRWSEFGVGPGQLCWGHDVAVDETGDVYVAEVYTGQRVQKFRRSTF
jgi:peptidylamidoglycolate lyase